MRRWKYGDGNSDEIDMRASCIMREATKDPSFAVEPRKLLGYSAVPRCELSASVALMNMRSLQ